MGEAACDGQIRRKTAFHGEETACEPWNSGNAALTWEAYCAGFEAWAELRFRRAG